MYSYIILNFSRKNSLIWVLNHLKVFYYMDHLALEKHYVQEQSPIELTLVLFVSLVLNLCKNMLERFVLFYNSSINIVIFLHQGARMVRELFEMARGKKACIIFFDEVDAIGGARFDDGAGGDNEVQRTMLELINQLDGFDPRGNIKVLMATNRPDTLDPALVRPGRLDRKVEFNLPDLEVCLIRMILLINLNCLYRAERIYLKFIQNQ